MPSWLPAVLKIADFIAQRVDRAGPVSFEPPEKQPPERALSAASSVSQKTKATSDSDAQSSETERSSETDKSPLGFQASGGNTDPSSGNGGGGGGTDPDDDDDENELRCSFRSMRVKDRPTTYEV